MPDGIKPQSLHSIRFYETNKMTLPLLTIGTRGSPLALAQAHETQRSIAELLHIDAKRFGISVLMTTGDQIQDRPLSEAGGKGLFTKELDSALLNNSIDLAVHSAKDLPTTLPDGLKIAGYLPREDARDAFISLRAKTLQDLPFGSVIGTASLRRQAMVRHLRPDCRVTLLRGNVGTRLRKLEEGLFDATYLAVAGLKRLGLVHHVTSYADTDLFLPAIGQGAIAFVIREEDHATLEIVKPLCHIETETALKTERAFLKVLDGSCRTPIAGYAYLEQDIVHFSGIVLKPDGSDFVKVHNKAPANQAEQLGQTCAYQIFDRAKQLLGNP